MMVSFSFTTLYMFIQHNIYSILAVVNKLHSPHVSFMQQPDFSHESTKHALPAACVSSVLNIVEP